MDFAASPNNVPLLYAAFATTTLKSDVKFWIRVMRPSVGSVPPPFVSKRRSTGVAPTSPNSSVMKAQSRPSICAFSNLFPK